MTKWITEKQALEYLNLEATEKNALNLRNLAYRKKIRKVTILRAQQYDQDSLDEYRESLAIGKSKD